MTCDPTPALSNDNLSVVAAKLEAVCRGESVVENAIVALKAIYGFGVSKVARDDVPEALRARLLHLIHQSAAAIAAAVDPAIPADYVFYSAGRAHAVLVQEDLGKRSDIAEMVALLSVELQSVYLRRRIVQYGDPAERVMLAHRLQQYQRPMISKTCH